jgi:hypothetical protein
MYAPAHPGGSLSGRASPRIERRSQATRRGQNGRIQAVGNALAKTEAGLRNRSESLPGITRSVSTHMSIQKEQHNVAWSIGTLDGDGAGDHDQAYRLIRRMSQ